MSRSIAIHVILRGVVVIFDLDMELGHWVNGSTIWVIFHVRVIGSPGLQFDPE